ncbi:hypothetical protein Tco_1110797 [Tanacetum coccineum]|uniref:Xylulose kinase-1 n=1 Tax=Tanacetum coccineum TaxID=301880 RepID=A0ABQ5IJU0_9ASTR
MANLKFANTHNLVAFLSKPAESEGFEKIVDFLNAQPIRYALTINPTIYVSCIEQFWSTVKVKTVNGEVQLQALVDGKKIIVTESTVRRDIQLEDAKGVDCLPNATIFEQLTLMGVATTATSLDAERDGGNINKTQSKATPNESSSLGTTSGGGPRCQETIGDTIAQTRFENVSKHSNDPLLAKGNTLQSSEDSLKLEELMKLCTPLQKRVLTLETTKTTQANEIDSLKRMVKRLEKKDRKRTHKLKRLYKGRIANIDADEDITLVNDQDDADMLSVNDLDDDEVIVDIVDVVKTAEETRSVVEEVTAVIEKAKLVSAAEEIINAAATTVSTASTIPVSAATTTTTTTAIINVEITLAQALAELKSAKPKADKLAQRPQAQEQEELTDEEKARLFVQFFEQRRNHFAAKRAEKKRNRPPIRAQQRSIMCTYLKNMEGWKHRSLKNKSFANIQELFEKAMKRVNTFVVYITELVEESSKKAETKLEENLKRAKVEVMEGSSKRAGEELEQESSKKQKVEEDKESEELKQCLEIVPDDGDDVTIDATPLSIKSPTIMLKNFNRKDLEVLWSIVKAIFKKTEPVDYMDNLLLHHLKTMFEHHVEDNVWKNQQEITQTTSEGLIDCETSRLIMECEMAFELLRLVKKQLL